MLCPDRGQPTFLLLKLAVNDKYIVYCALTPLGSGVSANRPIACSGGHLPPKTDAFSTKSRICCASSEVSTT